MSVFSVYAQKIGNGSEQISGINFNFAATQLCKTCTVACDISEKFFYGFILGGLDDIC